MSFDRVSLLRAFRKTLAGASLGEIRSEVAETELWEVARPCSRAELCEVPRLEEGWDAPASPTPPIALTSDLSWRAGKGAERRLDGRKTVTGGFAIVSASPEPSAPPMLRSLFRWELPPEWFALLLAELKKPRVALI